MDTRNLNALLERYRKAPSEFQATSYWESYERDILDTISSMDVAELRSGRHPILATFGFGDTAYYYHPGAPRWKNAALKAIQGRVIAGRAILPYGLSQAGIEALAYRHCELAGEVSGAKPISAVEMSTFGNPKDVFHVDGRPYTIGFLDYFVRYAYAHQHVSFRGDEVVVELGSGSGYQVEILKKLYSGLTILCFDLPGQIFLCEAYLREALGPELVVGTEATMDWSDLSGLEKGRVYCFGNWQFPLLSELGFELFWNAASFGEMEPEVVESYLGYLRGNAAAIYLLQAREGKETTGATRVQRPITFDDYIDMLPGYRLLGERDAWTATRPVSVTRPYFEGVWQRNPQ